MARVATHAELTELRAELTELRAELTELRAELRAQPVEPDTGARGADVEAPKKHRRSAP